MTLATLLRDRDGPIIQAPPEATLRDIVAQLTEHRIGAVPIVAGEAVRGIVSERDVIHALREGGAAALDWPAERVMTQPAISVASSLSLLAGLALMTERRIRHLPVVEGGRMIGFVSIGDLVKARIEGIEREAEAMRSYIAG